MKLPRPLHQNPRTATRMRGGRHRPPPPCDRRPCPRPRAWLLLLLPPALFLLCCAVAVCYMTRLHNMVFSLMINTAGCGAKSSPFGGAIVPVQGHARQRRPGPGGPPCCGVAKGAEPGSGVGGGGGGAGFEARPPPSSCRAEYASVTAGRTPGVANQDLRWLEAWLGNRRRLMGVMARLLLPARRCRPVVAVVARGSISLGHGVTPGARGTPTASRGEFAPLIGRGCRLC